MRPPCTARVGNNVTHVFFRQPTHPERCARHSTPPSRTSPLPFLLALTGTLIPREQACSRQSSLGAPAGLALQAHPHLSLQSFALSCASEPFSSACISTAVHMPGRAVQVQHCLPILDALPCSTALQGDALPAFTCLTALMPPQLMQNLVSSQPSVFLPPTPRWVQVASAPYHPSSHLSRDLPSFLPFRSGAKCRFHIAWATLLTVPNASIKVFFFPLLLTLMHTAMASVASYCSLPSAGTVCKAGSIFCSCCATVGCATQHAPQSKRVCRATTIGNKQCAHGADTSITVFAGDAIQPLTVILFKPRLLPAAALAAPAVPSQPPAAARPCPDLPSMQMLPAAPWTARSQCHLP